MKVLIFYRQDSEQRRAVDEFVHEFHRRYPELELTLTDIDTISGSRDAEIYDIVQYPTVIATSNDGATLQRWNAGLMPLINEVAYYANQ
jgi:methyl coenzyme M reductase alpha subunit